MNVTWVKSNRAWYCAVHFNRTVLYCGSLMREVNCFALVFKGETSYSKSSIEERETSITHGCPLGDTGGNAYGSVRVCARVFVCLCVCVYVCACVKNTWFFGMMSSLAQY